MLNSTTMTADYMHGFCKTASDYGFNPEHLLKVAAQGEKNFLTRGGELWDAIKESYNNLSPETKAMILGGLGTGLGTFMFSNGTIGDRLMNALGIGGLGALGGYALKKSKILDNIKLVNPIQYS